MSESKLNIKAHIELKQFEIQQIRELLKSIELLNLSESTLKDVHIKASSKIAQCEISIRDNSKYLK